MRDEPEEINAYYIVGHALLCCVLGVLIGPILFLILGFLTGSLISIGFGLMGLFYLPILGLIVGGLVGIIASLIYTLNRYNNQIHNQNQMNHSSKQDPNS